MKATKKERQKGKGRSKEQGEQEKIINWQKEGEPDTPKETRERGTRKIAIKKKEDKQNQKTPPQTIIVRFLASCPCFCYLCFSPFVKASCFFLRFGWPVFLFFLAPFPWKCIFNTISPPPWKGSFGGHFRVLICCCCRCHCCCCCWSSFCSCPSCSLLLIIFCCLLLFVYYWWVLLVSDFYLALVLYFGHLCFLAEVLLVPTLILLLLLLFLLFLFLFFFNVLFLVLFFGSSCSSSRFNPTASTHAYKYIWEHIHIYMFIYTYICVYIYMWHIWEYRHGVAILVYCWVSKSVPIQLFYLPHRHVWWFGHANHESSRNMLCFVVFAGTPYFCVSGLQTPMPWPFGHHLGSGTLRCWKALENLRCKNDTGPKTLENTWKGTQKASLNNGEIVSSSRLCFFLALFFWLLPVLTSLLQTCACSKFSSSNFSLVSSSNLCLH